MKINRTAVVLIVLIAFSIPFGASAGSLQLYAAGSLKQALGDVAAAYERTYQIKVATQFGPSGLLRKSIEGGERPDVFASADMTHPEKLAGGGWGGPVVLFVRNQLCALAQPDVSVTGENFLTTLLDPKVNVGTSTPKADPSGDYAWELFQKADAMKKGSFEALSGKALQLTGGPNSPKPPEGRNAYGWVMSERKADVFLTYCTNAVLAQKEVQALKIVRVPDELAVGADYGVLVRKDAPSEAWRLAMYILSPAGQKILRQYGFEAVAVPK